MAVLAHWIPQTVIHPDYNPLITADLEKFTAEQWWPPHHQASSNTAFFVLTTHYPVAANAHAISAFKAKSYFDDYYNRIHIAPASLTLGNVASEQVSSVSVWNAYLVTKSLDAIANVPEGIALTGQPATPINFTGLLELSWTVSVLINGPMSIDAAITWQFPAGNPVTLNISGTRIVAFGWPVDWSNGVTEQLTWLTDILRSDAGYEQRRALRLAPRINLEADVLVYGAERQYFDHAMSGWSARTFVLPVWPQQQWLATAHSIGSAVIACDTANRNFRAGRLAILRGETAFDNETVEILSVASNSLTLKRPLLKAWPKGTCLAPAVTAQLNALPQMIKRTDSVMRTHVTFNVTEAVDYPESMPATSYRGFPVFEDKPDETNDLTHSHERLLQQLDNSTGIPLQLDTAKAAFWLYQYSFLTAGRAQQHNMRGLFYALRGAQKAVWIPTHSSDLTIKAAISAGSNILDIQWCGYARFAFGQMGRIDIRIQLRSGTVLYRRIISAVELNSSTERLGVDSNFIAPILATDVVMISYICLARLSNDSVTIQHVTDSDGVAKCDVTFRGVRDV